MRTSPNKRFNEKNKTKAVHVRHKSLDISLPSSAKKQREMTKFCVTHGNQAEVVCQLELKFNSGLLQLNIYPADQLFKNIF